MIKLITVAANLILIASAGYLTTFNETNVNLGPNIYEEYYTSYPNMESATEGRDASALLTLKDNAYFAYDAKDFVQSAALFSEVLKIEKTATNYFYAGMSNLEIGNHTIANKNLNTVINNYEDLIAQSQWYLALNLLNEGSEISKDEALSSLVDLALGESSYKSNAETILAKMGISLANRAGGVIIVIYERPSEEDAPDGSEVDARGERKVQWGQIIDNNGLYYRFFNDAPIDGLVAGDEVEMIILKKGGTKEKMGFVFILG